jgi:hypothetical protein
MPLTDDPVWLEDVLSPALGNRLRILPDWKESGVGGTMGRIWGIIWHCPADARASAQSIRNGRPDLQPPPDGSPLTVNGSFPSSPVTSGFP